MKLLALETSTDACSVAVLADDSISCETLLAPRRHTDLVLGMIQQQLQQAGITMQQLDAIAYGRGPGAFTGLRIATGVVQGLAYGLELPVIPVSTLAVVAHAAYQRHQQHDILAVMDARMNEVYVARYRYTDHGMQLLGEESVLPPESLELDHYRDCIGVGSGFAHYAEFATQAAAILPAIDASIIPTAEAVAALARVAFANGECCAAAEALPVYIRNNVAVKSVKT